MAAIIETKPKSKYGKNGSISYMYIEKIGNIIPDNLSQQFAIEIPVVRNSVSYTSAKYASETQIAVRLKNRDDTIKNKKYSPYI